MQQLMFTGEAIEPTKTIACGEQPQNRFENFGAAALSDTELLAILLHTGERGETALQIASELMAQVGSIPGIAGWQKEDFRRVKGIGPAKARQLAALVEIGRRLMRGQEGRPILSRADAVASYMQPLSYGLQVEKFWVLCLNRKNRLLKCVEVTSGTATNSLAHPREVFREAIRESASAIICVHNHPSGDPTPSSADIQVTRQLRDAAKTICIDLIDHVITGLASHDPAGQGHYSFRAAGLL